MAHIPQGSDTGHPDMDYQEHNRVYDGFVQFAAVGTAACLAIVAALAIGATKHAWLFVSISVLVTLIATAIGIASKSISWKAPGAVLVFLLLALLVMPGSH
jgi:peptidoglycan/LPS O-acetylase OafA/YrhL